MKDYLSGYLDILPESQRGRIEDILKGNTTVIDKVSEAEFDQIIKMIAEDHEQVTSIVEQGDRIGSREFNQFFTNLQIDLNVMFNESQLIERALNSYDRLYEGILADLSKEIKALSERANSLRLVAEGEQGLIVKSFDFVNSSEMETDRANNSHLFRDRDGSNVPDVVVQRTSDQSYLSLNKQVSSDKIRDEQGNTIAQIQILDHRGQPQATDKYPLANAIDGSTDSYWGEIVLSDEPISVGMDDVSAGGVLVKFSVVLPKQELVSQISLSPFTTYPLEIVSIKYEEDIETYHEPKELVKDKIESTGTISVQFPSVIGKRFTFILRQKNYIRNSYMVREDLNKKNELWDKIVKREVEVSISGPNTNATIAQGDLDKYSGWDIYVTELKKFEDEYAQYMTKLNDYNAKYARYQQELASYRSSYGYR